MAHVTIDYWWTAKEMPLVESDWRNIKLYCAHETENPFEWDRCLYLIRLAPPYAIVYGDDCQLVSPLLYVGSGAISQRWSNHRTWLRELGDAIPGGRYEVWVTRPRSTNNQAFYKDVEADILTAFYEKTRYLPLRNRRIEGSPRQHSYGKMFFANLLKRDRRYLWGMYPLRGTVMDHYYKGY